LKNIFQNIILNSWFIAIVLGLLVFSLIPFHTDPYKANIVFGEMFSDKGTQVQFHDLNNDGFDEIIKSLYLEDGQLYSQLVLESNGNTRDQWNVEGVENSRARKCFVGDYNHDGFAELFSVFVRAGKFLLR